VASDERLETRQERGIMASAPTPKLVIPNPQAPKTLGILSIIFGSVLLLFGTCQGFMIIFGPTFGRLMDTSLKDTQAQIDAERQSELNRLKSRELAAESPEEKARIQSERQALEARPKVRIQTTSVAQSFDQFRDPVFMAYTWASTSTGLLLDVFMIVTGIGLLRLRPWGRTGSLWMAGLRIARVLFFSTISMLVIVPRTIELQRKQFQEIENQMKAQGQAPPPGLRMSEFSKISAAATYGGIIAYVVFAPIYPIILLVALNRPRVKAAFVALNKPEYPETFLS
jgi:hypothetical protein